MIKMRDVILPGEDDTFGSDISEQENSNKTIIIAATAGGLVCFVLGN